MVELPTITIMGGVILFVSAICIPVIALKVFKKDLPLEQAKRCLHER